MTGWVGSPWILVARPVRASTVTRMPQLSGQSWVQTAWTVWVVGFGATLDGKPVGFVRCRCGFSVADLLCVFLVGMTEFLGGRGRG